MPINPAQAFFCCFGAYGAGAVHQGQGAKPEDLPQGAGHGQAYTREELDSCVSAFRSLKPQSIQDWGVAVLRVTRDCDDKDLNSVGALHKALCKMAEAGQPPDIEHCPPDELEQRAIALDGIAALADAASRGMDDYPRGGDGAWCLAVTSVVRDGARLAASEVRNLHAEPEARCDVEKVLTQDHAFAPPLAALVTGFLQWRNDATPDAQ